MTTELVRYEAARAALAECKSVDEVKAIRDKAEAVRAYAHMAGDTALEQDAAEIRLRAERKLGELLIEIKAAGRLAAGRPAKPSAADKNGSDDEPFSQEMGRIKLSDLGVDKKLSAHTQKIGGIAERAFEAMVQRTRAKIADGRVRASLDVLRDQSVAERRATRLREMAELAANPLALPVGPFGAGIADPPWEDPDAPIGQTDRHYRNHYPTLTPAQVAEFVDVAGRRPADIFGPVAFLGMWITRHHLAIGSHNLVLPVWGFTPTTVITWDKELIGLGNGFVRDRTEHVVFAVRGNPPVPEPADRPPSLFAARKSRKHSEKPAWLHERIEAWFGEVSRVELFSRSQRPGWVAWGHRAETIDPGTGEIVEGRAA